LRSTVFFIPSEMFLVHIMQCHNLTLFQKILWVDFLVSLTPSSFHGAMRVCGWLSLYSDSSMSRHWTRDAIRSGWAFFDAKGAVFSLPGSPYRPPPREGWVGAWHWSICRHLECSTSMPPLLWQTFLRALNSMNIVSQSWHFVFRLSWWMGLQQRALLHSVRGGLGLRECVSDLFKRECEAIGRRVAEWKWLYLGLDYQQLWPR
jgi:hypothetical protein